MVTDVCVCGEWTVLIVNHPRHVATHWKEKRPTQTLQLERAREKKRKRRRRKKITATLRPFFVCFVFLSFFIPPRLFFFFFSSLALFHFLLLVHISLRLSVGLVSAFSEKPPCGQIGGFFFFFFWGALSICVCVYTLNADGFGSDKGVKWPRRATDHEVFVRSRPLSIGFVFDSVPLFSIIFAPSTTLPPLPPPTHSPQKKNPPPSPPFASSSSWTIVSHLNFGGPISVMIWIHIGWSWFIHIVWFCPVLSPWCLTSVVELGDKNKISHYLSSSVRHNWAYYGLVWFPHRRNRPVRVK